MIMVTHIATSEHTGGRERTWAKLGQASTHRSDRTGQASVRGPRVTATTPKNARLPQSNRTISRSEVRDTGAATYCTSTPDYCPDRDWPL